MTDVNYWESEYGLMNNKSVPIPTAQNNLMLVFIREEFYELKRLLNHDKILNISPCLTMIWKAGFSATKTSLISIV